MINKIIDQIQIILNNQNLKKKLIFTAFIFFVYRLLANIPAPGIDVEKIQAMVAGNQILNFVNMFSGGALSRSSIVAVGISPYITASIIIQLISMIYPKLKEMQKEGEAGKQKVNQYTRIISVPIGIVQSIGVLAILLPQGYLESTDITTLVLIITSLVAGSTILMWLGELVTINGIGNGISMIMLAGIISQLPMSFGQALLAPASNQYVIFAVFIALFLGVIALMVFVNEAVRKIPIQYARRIKGSRSYGGHSTHLPIKINVAGVMPIIFSVSLMMIPSFVGNLFIKSTNQTLIDIGENLIVWFDQTSFIYMLVYFLLVFMFTFFSAIIFFNAEDLSKELKKSGAFVPGIRPGGPTKNFLEYVVIRITFLGALFLGLVALLPSLAQILTGVGSLAIGGTSILIIVSVILETAKQVDSILVGENYEQYT